MDGFALIWDGFMWLILGYGHLSTWTNLLWEWKNHSKRNQPNYTRNMGWISLQGCSHSVVFSHYRNFRVQWHWPVLPPRYLLDGSKWDPLPCSTNLWSWLPPGWWLLHYGFSLGLGRICPMVMTTDHPLFKVTWAYSVFTGTTIWPLSLSPPLACRTL